jgi:pilus assembly protein Flp/PilA
MMKALRNLVRKDDGASMVEYTVILGLVVALTIGAIELIGGQVDDVFGVISDGTDGLGSIDDVRTQ